MRFYILVLLIIPSLVHSRIRLPKKLKAKGDADRNALSDLPHVINGRHNTGFDHEAFLGRDRARRFDQLSEAEAKAELEKIVHEIDTDGNREITANELVNWMKKVHIEDRMAVVRDSWKHFNLKPTETLSLEKHSPHFFSEDAKDNELMMKNLADTKRRWSASDENNDGNLSQKEFVAFLNPSDWDHMHSILLEETLEEYDKNKDGYISKDEYMEVVYPNGMPAQGDEEPLIVREEREVFENSLDANKDGQLDETEIMQWILPQHGAMQLQARHLVVEADSNKNDSLDRNEIMERWELFVGSRLAGLARDEL